MLINDMLPTRPPGATVPVGSTQSKETTSCPAENERKHIISEIKQQQISQEAQNGLEFLKRTVAEILEKKPDGLNFCLFKKDLINNGDVSDSENFVTLPTEEIITQIAFDLAKYYFLEDNIQTASEYYKICIENFKKKNDKWIGYFDNDIKEAENGLHLCEGILDINRIKENDEFEIDGLVNKCMAYLTTGKHEKCYEMLINDTCFMKIGLDFRKMIELQVTACTE